MNKHTFYPALFLVAALPILSVQTAQAQYHLVIDISDRSAVTFTATSEFALVNATDTAFEGIELELFFPANSYGTWGNVDPSSDLYANGLSEANAYNVVDNNFTPVTRRDLLLYVSSGGSVSQTFSTSAPAFYGQMIVDLDGVTDSFIVEDAQPLELGPVGHTGDILLGSFGGVKVGEYIIVPEPSSLALMGLAGLCVLRRSRRG